MTQKSPEEAACAAFYDPENVPRQRAAAYQAASEAGADPDDAEYLAERLADAWGEGEPLTAAQLIQEREEGEDEEHAEGRMNCDDERCRAWTPDDGQPISTCRHCSMLTTNLWDKNATDEEDTGEDDPTYDQAMQQGRDACTVSRCKAKTRPDGQLRATCVYCVWTEGAPA